MAVARNSLRCFLTHAKDVLRSAIKSNEKVTLVIGNESAGQHLQCTNESI
jgi:exopolyphosphatase